MVDLHIEKNDTLLSSFANGETKLDDDQSTTEGRNVYVGGKSGLLTSSSKIRSSNSADDFNLSSSYNTKRQQIIRTNAEEKFGQRQLTSREFTQSSPDLLAAEFNIDEEFDDGSFTTSDGRQTLKRWQSTDFDNSNKHFWKSGSTASVNENKNYNYDMQNGYHHASHHSQHHQYQSSAEQHWRREDVDYSPQDFRRNLATIDHAARLGSSPVSSGTSYPAGGLKVRREGDTTVVTEHRDPYSFYWQLDKIKRQEEPPPRRDEIGENVIEEYIADDIT